MKRGAQLEYELNQKNTSAMCQETEKKKFNNKNFLKPQGTQYQDN